MCVYEVYVEVYVEEQFSICRGAIYMQKSNFYVEVYVEEQFIEVYVRVQKYMCNLQKYMRLQRVEQFIQVYVRV